MLSSTSLELPGDSSIYKTEGLERAEKKVDEIPYIMYTVLQIHHCLPSSSHPLTGDRPD